MTISCNTRIQSEKELNTCMDLRRHFPLSKLMSIFSLSIFSMPIEVSPIRVAFISVRINVAYIR